MFSEPLLPRKEHLWTALLLIVDVRQDGVRKNDPGKKGPRKNAPLESCPQESCPLPKKKKKNGFTRFLLLLTLS